MLIEAALRRYGIREYDIVDELPTEVEQGAYCVVQRGTEVKCHVGNDGKWEEMRFLRPLEETLLRCPICGKEFDDNGFCILCD